MKRRATLCPRSCPEIGRAERPLRGSLSEGTDRGAEFERPILIRSPWEIVSHSVIMNVYLLSLFISPLCHQPAVLIRVVEVWPYG